jgi:tetratricopeptide (TPR) repeat protein
VADGAYAEAVAYYEANRVRFACADVTIESLWAVGDAYAALERPDDAFAVYHRVLDECDDTDLRLATLEKAIARQDQPRFEALLAVEEERGHAEAELERLARIRKDGLGDGPTGPVRLSRLDRTLQAVGARRASAEDLAWLAEHARDARNANAAMVLGYHHLDGGRPQAAVDWFERSLAWRRTTKALEGLYHAFGRLGRDDEQRRLAARHPQALAAIAGGGAANTHLAKAWQALEEGDAERALIYADVAGGEADAGERDLVRGWALLEQDRSGEAETAFARAATDAAPQTRASAAKGRALALIAAGRDDEVAVDSSLPEADVDDIERAKLERRIVDIFEAGEPEQAHQLLRERARRFPGAPSMGALEGWILYEKGDLYAADRFFSQLWVETKSRAARKGMMTVRDAMYPNG